MIRAKKFIVATKDGLQTKYLVEFKGKCFGLLSEESLFKVLERLTRGN